MADNFEQAIKERNKQNIKSEFTFIGMKETNLKNMKKLKTNYLHQSNLFLK